MSHPFAKALSLYAVTAPGLESITAAELRGLDLQVTGQEPGGVSFEGALDDLARANLWLRTASRIVVRVTTFRVRALGELERKAGSIGWRSWLAPGIPVRLRVSCKKSRLYHQKAVAERIGNTLVASGWEISTGAEPVEESEEESARAAEAQLLMVRIFRDECTISLDSSGALLHRRGYRLASGKAPLRETLAAGLILASGWDPASPLIDPFGGSGTIPIEAALIARRIPPGRLRSFAFQRWPWWTAARWNTLIEAADRSALSRAPAPIHGSDRDGGAITAINSNAERAGVAADLTVIRTAVSGITPPSGPGSLISNPPYGVRVGDQGELRDLYARLGQVAYQKLAGWRLTLMVPAFPLERQIDLHWEELFRTRNGGLSVRGISAAVPPAGDGSG